MKLNFGPIWRFWSGNESRWLLAAVLAFVATACGAGGELPPTPATVERPTPTAEQWPTVTPPPTPVRGTEYQRMQPDDMEIRLVQKANDALGYPIWEADTTFPALELSHTPYNACTLPGDHRVDWQPGRIMVYVHQLVGFPDGGCPSGRRDTILQYIALDRLANGDEVWVNGEYWFRATNVFCRDYRYGSCPVGCTAVCRSSSPPGALFQTADCGGEHSCMPPFRKGTPEPHQK